MFLALKEFTKQLCLYLEIMASKLEAHSGNRIPSSSDRELFF